MKFFVVLLACLFVLGTALPVHDLGLQLSAPHPKQRIAIDRIVPVGASLGNEAALCSPCIQIAEQGLNILLNYVLQAGVVGGCSKICSNLNSTAAREACDLVCTIAGVKEFVKAIEHADLDPIYFCEVLKACPAGPDSAAAKPIAVTTSPTSGPSGTKFTLNFEFEVVNATGVGEIRLAIHGHVNTQVGQSFLNMGYAPGNYAAKISLDTTDSDPSSQDPVIWGPGPYTATFELCQGECGSKHPHSFVFGAKNGTFTIS